MSKPSPFTEKSLVNRSTAPDVCPSPNHSIGPWMLCSNQTARRVVLPVAEPAKMMLLPSTVLTVSRSQH